MIEVRLYNREECGNYLNQVSQSYQGKLTMLKI